MSVAMERRVADLQMRVHQLETVIDAADENYRQMQEKFTHAERENDLLKARVAALEDQLKTLGEEVPDGGTQIH